MNTLRRMALGLILHLLLGGTDPSFGAPANGAATYMVGVGRIDITPGYPIRLNGFGNRRRESEGVSQRIYATALAISDDDNRTLVLVAVDSLGIRVGMVDEVARRLGERYGIPREHVAVTFTHSHCTPKVNGAADNIFSQPIPPAHQAHIDRYTRELTDNITAAAAAAWESRRPSRLSWGVGKVGFAVNRRTPGGPVDHDLPVLFVRDADDDRLRAVYASYACHCVTLSFNQISGDWAGYAVEMIERSSPGVTALVSIGCGSDSNPSSGVTGDKIDVARGQGAQIADEVSRLLKAELKPLSGPLHAKLARIALPLHDPPGEEQLRELAARGGPAGYNATTQLEKKARGEKLLTDIDYTIQTFAFGEQLAMVFLAGEVCVDYALRLKQELARDRLWVNAYANDFCSYIPSERLVREGGYGGGSETPYFALPATLRPGLEQLIVDEVKRQVPRSLHVADGTRGIPPKSPEASRQCLQTHGDLRVELVAAEPLVVDPVAIDFGPDGRLWVAEMRDYGRGVYESFRSTGRVRWLRDTDGDGRLDAAETFLDGLRFPTDVKVQPDGVLICDAPDILLASDRDGDGRADEVRKLYTGFEVRNAQARVNSLRLGLDNWLYGSGGLFGGRITTVESGVETDLSGRDFRFHPETRRIEAVAGRTQQGRCRNDWGDWFGCTNSALLLHYPVPSRYHRRNPRVASPPTSVSVAGGDASRLVPAGELVRFELSGAPGQPTAACGLTFYRDRWLGDAYRGNAFVCEPVHQLVHRLVLEPKGVTYTARRPERDRAFLASTDRWFRPVQARTGPDGALWVVDMYRFVIEHRRWIPQDTLAGLDIFAGRQRGRIYRVVPRGKGARPWPRVDRMNDAQLVRQLDQPNGTLRDLAQQQLVARRSAASAPMLRSLLGETTRPEAQIHALYTLQALDALAPGDLLAGLHSTHTEVVRHAVRLSEPMLDDAPIRAAVLRLSRHAEPRVRQQLAYSLGETDADDAAQVLGQLAAGAEADDYLRSAVLSSVHPANAAAVLDGYAAHERGRRGELFSQLAGLAVQLGDTGTVESVLRRATSPGTDPTESFAVLAALLDAADARDDIRWDALAGRLPALRRGCGDAKQVLADPEQPVAARLAALRLLGRRPGAATRQLIGAGDSGHLASIEQIAELISARQPVALQREAVAALARMAAESTADHLLARWDSAGPTARDRIFDVMLSRDAWTASLLEAVDAGTVPPASFDATRRQRLLAHDNAAIRRIADRLFDGAASADRQAVIERYHTALAASAEGDADRGRLRFRKVCAGCHRLEDYGHAVGPDLSALTNRDPKWLLTEILDPNRRVDARYLAWTALDVDGRTVTGLLVEETPSSIRLVEADGKERVILRHELDVLRSTGRSAMPEGIERDIAPRDMSDLLAYLALLAKPAKSFAGNQPRTISANERGELELTAAAAEIRGNEIRFEPAFGNIGYWHGEDDHATWHVAVERSGKFDVWLDFACAAESAGNGFRIDGLPSELRGAVPGTGGWSRYAQRRIGTTHLAAGQHVIVVRPDGPLVRRALMDLREVRLVPADQPTRFTSAASADDRPLPRRPAEIAPFLLDDNQPTERRQAVIDQRPGMGPAIVSLLAGGIGDDHEEEYRRIPWIWRVAIATGKRNDGGELRDLLDVSLPKAGEPLRDWQAVVIGGGVINGISQLGLWPGERLREVVAGVPEGPARWQRALKLSAAMADNPRVRSGTRYDALRMIALEGWEKRGAHLQRYLADGVKDELQMGAVSGLVDIRHKEVAGVLIRHVPRLSERNRKLAVDGLLRTEGRSLALLDALAAGRVDRKHVPLDALLNHDSPAVRKRAKDWVNP